MNKKSRWKQERKKNKMATGKYINGENKKEKMFKILSEQQINSVEVNE